MQKAPEYDRIQHILRSSQEPLTSDDEAWIQNYLDLGDKALKVQQSAPTASRGGLSNQHSASKQGT